MPPVGATVVESSCRGGVGVRTEDLRAAAEQDRLDHQPVLVDEVVAGQRRGALLLTAGSARLESVAVIGADEHRWVHTRSAQADGCVTVFADLTDVVAGHGPARLRDVVSGRSAAVLTGWLADRDQDLPPPSRGGPTSKSSPPTPTTTEPAASRSPR